MKINQKGFSIIEIMVALGLLGGISVAIMSLMDNAQKGQKGLQTRVEFDNLRNSLSLMIMNQSLCTTGFINESGSPAKFNPLAAIPSSQKLTTITIGGAVIAKINKDIAPGLKLTRLELVDSGIPAVVNGTRKTYLTKLFIEATRANATGSKILSNKANPYLINVTTNSTNDIVACGGTSQISLTYPTSCTFTFGHQDISAPVRSVNVPFDGSGHRGIKLVGNVDSNDKFLFRGYCNPNLSALDKFMSTCRIDLGMKDITDTPTSAHDNPTHTASATMMQSSLSVLTMAGDVDENDSFYFRMRCPETSTPELLEAQEHIFQKCHLCFGYSDINRPQMDTRMCTRVAPMSNTRWTRMRFTGDVDMNDVMFPGFYCENDTGSLVHSVLWQ